MWVRVPPAAPRRKSQRVLVRLAEFIRPIGGLGGHLVFNFGGKNELAVSHFGGRKFFNHMNQKGFANIILTVVVIVILAGAVGYFAFVKKSEQVAQQPTLSPVSPTPTPTPTPKTVTPTPSKPYSPPVVGTTDGINTFVKNANFPKSTGVNLFINAPAQNLKVFRVSYGEPQDCPSGCFNSNATGIEYGSKIGWISINDYDHINVSRLVMYDFDSSDTYLYSDEFFQLLKSKDDWVYQNAFLLKLAEDKDVPRAMLLKLANGLSSYIQPSLASNLLENPVVENDREILTIIANLPVFSGDAYSQVRTKAKDLLK